MDKFKSKRPALHTRQHRSRLMLTSKVFTSTSVSATIPGLPILNVKHVLGKKSVLLSFDDISNIRIMS